MPVIRKLISYSDRVRVRELAAVGASQEDIAAPLRLPLPTFQRIFKNDLQEGAAHGRELALKRLHAIAISGNSVPTLNFWVKSQCGWRDTGASEGTPQLSREVIIFQSSGTGSGRTPA